ncbi:MAG: ATP synthase F1 subunit delta [Nitrospirae bacterium]|nr:ATP synthase F1 subunit delta [Nitrospirota bacterium]
MRNNTLAKRYAKALFELIYHQTRRDDVLLSCLERLKAISEGIRGNSSLKNVLYSPSFGIEDKKMILKSLIDRPFGEKIPADYANPMKSLLTLLVKKSRLLFLPEIVAELERLKNELSRTTPVLLTVPVSLLENERDGFAQKFERLFQQKIQLTVKVSPEILGGMSVQIGSKIFDGTLQMKLSRLRHNLME